MDEFRSNEIDLGRESDVSLATCGLEKDAYSDMNNAAVLHVTPTCANVELNANNNNNIEGPNSAPSNFPTKQRWQILIECGCLMEKLPGLPKLTQTSMTSSNVCDGHHSQTRHQDAGVDSSRSFKFHTRSPKSTSEIVPEMCTIPLEYNDTFKCKLHEAQDHVEHIQQRCTWKSRFAGLFNRKCQTPATDDNVYCSYTQDLIRNSQENIHEKLDLPSVADFFQNLVTGLFACDINVIE